MRPAAASITTAINSWEDLTASPSLRTSLVVSWRFFLQDIAFYLTSFNFYDLNWKGLTLLFDVQSDMTNSKRASAAFLLPTFHKPTCHRRPHACWWLSAKKGLAWAMVQLTATLNPLLHPSNIGVCACGCLICIQTYICMYIHKYRYIYIYIQTRCTCLSRLSQIHCLRNVTTYESYHWPRLAERQVQLKTKRTPLAHFTSLLWLLGSLAG